MRQFLMRCQNGRSVKSGDDRRQGYSIPFSWNPFIRANTYTYDISPRINLHNLLLLLHWNERWTEEKWKPTKNQIENRIHFEKSTTYSTSERRLSKGVRSAHDLILQKLLSTLLNWINSIQNSIAMKKRQNKKDNSTAQWRKWHNHI